VGPLPIAGAFVWGPGGGLDPLPLSNYGYRVGDKASVDSFIGNPIGHGTTVGTLLAGEQELCRGGWHASCNTYARPNHIEDQRGCKYLK